VWEDLVFNHAWKQTTRQKGSGNLAGNHFRFESKSIDEFAFSGLNANLGILCRITDRLNLGTELNGRS
jgi:hypothetical protein